MKLDKFLCVEVSVQPLVLMVVDKKKEEEMSSNPSFST